MSQYPTWQLEGFDFLEFSSLDESILPHTFSRMGFSQTKKHRSEPIFLYQQNHIHFIVNHTSNSQAASHAKQHGTGACAMGFRVTDVEKAYSDLLKKGAKPHIESHAATHHLPAIEAIGGSVIYLTDNHHQPFANDWEPCLSPPTVTTRLQFIDHLTHNVHRGNMDKWADFYIDLFHFKQIRYFDIEGLKTGLVSRALASQNDAVKIPLNESKDTVSQIEEFLSDYHGEGIQHIPLHTDHIYDAVTQMRQNHMRFLEVPDTYYDMIATRLPWHTEPLEALKNNRILIDGESKPNDGLLLQIFTENMFGPVFFEIIQRKGNQGFGEGNFKALFEAIERDQMKRGILK